MKVKCVRGPVFVDGGMMFSGDVRGVRHPSVAERLVKEHPDQLAFVKVQAAPEVKALADVEEEVGLAGVHQEQVVKEAVEAEVQVTIEVAALRQVQGTGKRGRRA